jgi:hypothetical protein
MAYEWPNYDPTMVALLHPEESHPEGLHVGGGGWPVEAVCAEFARLAYFRFEEPEGEARLIAALAQAGFGPPKLFNSKIPTFGNPLRRFLQSVRARDAQAFASSSDDGDVTILAFRGTQADSTGDLVSDLWAFRHSTSLGKVHKGFWLAYQSLADKIGAWLAEAPPRRLIVTGHSLGAAMATVMAALHKDVELITFGCPLVGDRRFAEAFGREALRYVDCADVVTTVPYRFMGYVHFGRLRYIDRHGTVHESVPDQAWIDEDRRQAGLDYRRYRGRTGVVPLRRGADHAPVNYVSAVAGKRNDP